MDALSPPFSSCSVEVPEFLSTLYTYMQRGIYKYFVPAAVSILAVCHQEAVVSWLLRAGHLMDRYVHYPLSPVIRDPATCLNEEASGGDAGLSFLPDQSGGLQNSVLVSLL